MLKVETFLIVYNNTCCYGGKSGINLSHFLVYILTRKYKLKFYIFILRVMLIT